MTDEARTTRAKPQARWRIVLAFALVYVSWGTTYLAISKGVETLPPALFSGSRSCLAGLIVLAYLALSRESLRPPRGELFWIFFTSLLLIVGGSGLLATGERTVASGEASILIATTPLWMALLERISPRGDRLTILGWGGLFVGLGGVAVLFGPGLRDPLRLIHDAGPWIVITSAFSWALGAFVLRRRKLIAPHLLIAAYQLILGGTSLSVVGLICGESRQLTPASFTPQAVGSFFYLLFAGSLIGFVAYNWLLNHTSLAMVGTYAYVNPVVAILVGWLLNGEAITLWIIGGMVIILSGVAAVRSGEVRSSIFDLRLSGLAKEENVPARSSGEGSLFSSRPREDKDRSSKLEDRSSRVPS
jgi:drug/metabolite transporter (DMT)-like permease